MVFKIHIFNNNLFELTQVHRFNDNSLLQDAYKCSNGGQIDLTQYGKTECDLSLCWTNRAVDAINKKWNEHYAKQHEQTVVVNGFKQSSFIVHKDLKIMAYTSRYGKYYNSEEFTVKSFNDKYITLLCDSEEFNIEIKETKNFKPVYAITCHKAQGQTIEKPYSRYEYKQMKHDMLYVCLTRTRQK